MTAALLIALAVVVVGGWPAMFWFGWGFGRRVDRARSRGGYVASGQHRGGVAR